MALLKVMKRSSFNQIREEKGLTLLLGRGEGNLHQWGFRMIK